MSWYLPDKHPIFWEAMRRRYAGRGRYGLLLFYLLFMLLPALLLFVIKS